MRAKQGNEEEYRGGKIGKKILYTYTFSKVLS
jgi:hypothetical protein